MKRGRRDRQTDRQTDRQAGRQAGRQSGKQTDRQTDYIILFLSISSTYFQFADVNDVLRTVKIS